MMAHLRVVRDWRRFWLFPWLESRRVGLFLDTCPTVPVDVSTFRTQWRWVGLSGLSKRRKRKEGE